VKFLFCIILVWIGCKLIWYLLPKKTKIDVASKLLREHDPKQLEQLERWKTINSAVFKYYSEELRVAGPYPKYANGSQFNINYAKFSTSAKRLAELMKSEDAVMDDNVQEIERIFNEILEDHIDVIPELKSLKRHSTLAELGIK